MIHGGLGASSPVNDRPLILLLSSARGREFESSSLHHSLRDPTSGCGWQAWPALSGISARSAPMSWGPPHEQRGQHHGGAHRDALLRQRDELRLIARHLTEAARFPVGLGLLDPLTRGGDEVPEQVA